MKTQWTITKDHLADTDAKKGTNANAVGIVGPRGATLTHDEIVNHADAVKFKMFDDDRNLYYEGVMVVEDYGSEEMFFPLDNFGTPNAGCTELQYLEDGSWKTL